MPSAEQIKMKNYKNKILAILLGSMALLISATQGAAAVTSTNWNWIDMELSIAQTNILIGDKIPVSIVISNTTDKAGWVRWATGDFCACGFAQFSIFEVSSSREIRCKIPEYNRTIVGATMPQIKGHNSMAFNFDLAVGFALTNAGSYTIQTKGWFATNELDAHLKHSIIITPPIIISLLPRPGISVAAETTAPMIAASPSTRAFFNGNTNRFPTGNEISSSIKPNQKRVIVDTEKGTSACVVDTDTIAIIGKNGDVILKTNVIESLASFFQVKKSRFASHCWCQKCGFCSANKWVFDGHCWKAGCSCRYTNWRGKACLRGLVVVDI